MNLAISMTASWLFDVEPLWRRELHGQSMPAVDISEKDKSYEITAELPGIRQVGKGHFGEARQRLR